MEAFPITWPALQRRTPSYRRRTGQFEVGFAVARDHLLDEVRKLDTRNVVISSNVPLRRDGLPYADFREPEDPGVAVYFERRAGDGWRPFVIACDSYSKVRANIRAIGLTVEALRSIARHGATEMLEQAFSGFAALPPASTAPAPVTEPLWWNVLGVGMQATEAEIRAAFRRLVEQHHPDRGGDLETMLKINKAYHDAMEARR